MSYPDILNLLLKKIALVKETDKDIAIVDIIMDFCVEESVELDMVSDAISDDQYFKELLELDCKNRGILKSEKKKLDEW